MSDVVIDVREKDEFEAEHIEHSINIPLSHFDSIAPGVLRQLNQSKISMMCRSGNRAKLALSRINQMGYGDKISASVFEGGILEWKRLGKPTLQLRRAPMPIMRQVQLIAGSGVLLGTLLGAFVNPWFLALSGFFGAGLAFAGATGFCGMALLLEKLQGSERSGSCPQS